MPTSLSLIPIARYLHGQMQQTQMQGLIHNVPKFSQVCCILAKQILRRLPVEQLPLKACMQQLCDYKFVAQPCAPDTVCILQSSHGTTATSFLTIVGSMLSEKSELVICQTMPP
eukprot:scaffold4080_cov235-Chaetoceros_neogracile.AAC.2